MPEIEVLVATMHQTNLSKFKEMNIQSDVFFANQTDRNEYAEKYIDNKRVRMISTNERGVGKNRNLALLFSKGEICLLGDEDIVYVDDYEQIVQAAFESLPTADIIVFNIETLGKKVKRRQNTKIKRVREHNFLNYGAVRIVFRRESVVRNNIWFSLRFGGGAIYGAGEDSLFLRDSLRKGLRVYTYPVKIAYVKQETSSWFNGYNKKYLFDKGAFLAAAFPLLKYLIAIYYSNRYRYETEYSFKEILKYLIEGMRAFKKGIGYEEK